MLYQNASRKGIAYMKSFLCEFARPMWPLSPDIRQTCDANVAIFALLRACVPPQSRKDRSLTAHDLYELEAAHDR